MLVFNKHFNDVLVLFFSFSLFSSDRNHVKKQLSCTDVVESNVPDLNHTKYSQAECVYELICQPDFF